MAWRILSACGISYRSIRHIATGATSEAWAIDSSDGRLVLRVAAPRAGDRSRYEADFGVRRGLLDLGGRVARPIATNQDVEAGIVVDWCLDEHVEGTAAGAALSPQGCRDLGVTLAALHSLPVDGHGLLANRRDTLRGERASAREGILSRLEGAWPFANGSLDDHPIPSEAPDLVKPLTVLKPSLLALLDARQRSVNHADLHGGQIVVSNGTLAAVLDFGDAVVAPPAWDIGSVGYFHGWRRAAHVLDGYTSDPARRAELIEQGRVFAIVIALHHANRSVTLNQPERMRGALRYLRENRGALDLDS